MQTKLSKSKGKPIDSVVTLQFEYVDIHRKLHQG